jgi:hypothetical protein
VKRIVLISVVVGPLLGAGCAWGQVVAHKCGNAAGLIEYSDKPCTPNQSPVPWRPKYSHNGEYLESQKSKSAEVPAHAVPEVRKSAYTRWLDNQDVSAVAAPAKP